MLAVLVGVVLALGAISAFVLAQARAAEKSGELRYSIRGLHELQVIRREDDPTRFEAEIRMLKAGPWFGATLMASAVLLMGVVL